MVLDQKFEELLGSLIGENRFRSLPAVTRTSGMQLWQYYIKPNCTGLIDDDGFEDGGEILSLPGLPEMPDLHLAGGLLHFDK